MTREDIIRLARDNGLRMSVQGSYFFIGFDNLGKLLDASAAAERERIIKIGLQGFGGDVCDFAEWLQEGGA